MPSFSIDPQDLKQLADFGNQVANPDITFKALRSAIGSATTVLAKETRKQIASYGFGRESSVLARNIVSRTSSSKRKQQVNARVGARNRNVDGQNPSKYFHLFDGGTKPHWQPNAWRLIDINGDPILIKMIGGAPHFGAAAHPVREPAQRKAAPAVNRKFTDQFRKVLFRELAKAVAKAKS